MFSDQQGRNLISDGDLIIQASLCYPYCSTQLLKKSMWQLHKSNTDLLRSLHPVATQVATDRPHAVVIYIRRVQGDNLSMLKGCYHDHAAHTADVMFSDSKNTVSRGDQCY